MAAKKKLKLEGGLFARDGKPDDDPTLTPELCLERAAACLEEAARSQHPVNEAYTHQAEVWFNLADSLKPKEAP